MRLEAGAIRYVNLSHLGCESLTFATSELHWHSVAEV